MMKKRLIDYISLDDTTNAQIVHELRVAISDGIITEEEAQRLFEIYRK